MASIFASTKFERLLYRKRNFSLSFSQICKSTGILGKMILWKTREERKRGKRFRDGAFFRDLIFRGALLVRDPFVDDIFKETAGSPLHPLSFTHLFPSRWRSTFSLCRDEASSFTTLRHSRPRTSSLFHNPLIQIYTQACTRTHIYIYGRVHAYTGTHVLNIHMHKNIFISFRSFTGATARWWWFHVAISTAKRNAPKYRVKT